MESEPGPPRVIGGRYELLDELGRGGMGVVYRARDRSLDETVALKLLRREFAGDPGLERRFRSEIKLARRVSHPNVCRIHDYGEDVGLLYISMELVSGDNLKDLVRTRGALPTGEAYDIALQVAAGLEAIHNEGIVHRDLKTTNLMRDAAGRVRIMDFGVARNLRAGAGEATGPGVALGTPEYMSPEQAVANAAVDARSDLYAFAVVLFELFTGALPFQGDAPLATLLKQLNDPPPLDGTLARRLPSALVPVLRRALSKEPGGRYASAAAMATALRAAMTASEISEAPTRGVTLPGVDTPAGAAERRAVARRRALWGAALLAVASGVAALALRGVPFPEEQPPAAPAAPEPRATPLAARPAPPTTRADLRERPATASPRAPSPAASAEPIVDSAEPLPPPALPVGTRLYVALHGELRSDRAVTGDAFTGSLAEPLSFEGRTVAHAGTALRGRVTAVGRTGSNPFLELGVTEIEMGGGFVPVRTGAFRLTAPAQGGGGPSVVAVVIGAIAGAGLGGAIDGGRGAATGAAAGAAAGAAIRSDPRGTVFTYSDRLPFRLAERLTLPQGIINEGGPS